MTVAALGVALAALAAAGPLASASARLAGARARPRLAGRRDGTGLAYGPLRLGALVAALAMLVGAPGDLLVAAGLAAVGTAAPAPATAGALVALGGIGALRVGSSAVEHVAAGHVILGPGFTSPEAPVAGAAALALAASVVCAAALVPGRPRGGMFGPLRSPGALADVVAPVAVAFAGVTVALGPPVVSGAGQPWMWFGVRVATALGVLVAAAAVRRLADRTSMLPSGSVPVAGLAFAGAGLLLALVAR